MPESNDIKIARLEEKFDGLREQHKAQAHETNQSFTSLNKKMDVVVGAHNKSKGFVAGIAAVMGVLGGYIGRHM